MEGREQPYLSGPRMLVNDWPLVHRCHGFWRRRSFSFCSQSHWSCSAIARKIISGAAFIPPMSKPQLRLWLNAFGCHCVPPSPVCNGAWISS